MVKTAAVFFFSAFIIGSGLPGSAAGREGADPLTLEACLLRAMEKNLDIRISILDSRRSGEGVALAGEKFLPTLAFSGGAQKSASASTSYLQGSGDVSTRYDDYAARLSQTLPTGGSLTAAVSSYKSDTNENYLTINPRYGSRLTFAISQPLLRDFGYRIPRKDILIARNNRDLSENTARLTALNTLLATETAYWELVYAIEDLKVKRRSVRLAQDLLDRSREQIRIGMMAPIEALTAESEVAAREAEILAAESLVKNNEDALRRILDIRTPADAAPEAIVPADAPAPDGEPVTIENAIASALAHRPELLSAQTSVRSRDLDLAYARNQLLPNLSLDLSYWSPGISGTQILYKDGNPLTGVIIGTIPGLASDAMKDALNFKYRNWSVGLTLTFPLNTILSRAAAAQAGLDAERSRLDLERTEQMIITEIRSAIRDVETNARRVVSYEAARRLAEKKLEGEERKTSVGLSTNYTLLQYQRDLVSARSLELRARIDYALSRARLDKAMGTSFKRWNISWPESGE